MKRLLLFVGAFSLTFISFSQVPANDLIENAIEIDPSNYVEENLRLDLATTTGFQNSGCPTGGNVKVFYKFMATANSVVSLEISDMIDAPITNSLVIFFMAPDLNQTDESQLNLASTCANGASSDLAVTAGQSYYVQVSRLDANTFSRVTVTFETPPPNDLIENALEITSSYFLDENLRLDLVATTNIGGQSCAVLGYRTVYYKFVARANANAIFNLFNQGGGTVTGSSFVIAYSAPSLNALDNELSVVSSCNFGTQANFSIIDGQTYYVIIHRDALDMLSQVQANIPQDGPPEERQALIDLYNATDGPNWAFNTNWNTAAPLSEWTNVNTENGHVVSVGISTFGAVGTLPSSLTDLTFLERAVFRSNNLFGEVPDLSSITTLEIFDVNQNKFSFGDLELNFTNNSTITDFRYTSQSSIDDPIGIEPAIGSNYTLSVTPDTGTNVNYQWFKQRATVSQNIIIDGATNPTLELTNIQADDIDSYTCEMTSSIIPDLTIRRSTINLTGPVSQQERDALIAFYNALDGDNWVDNTNWLSTEPVGNWSFITTRGNKVIGIRIFSSMGANGFNGEFPDEIGDLLYLERLDIALEPGLTGPIPSSIGNLTELQNLRLQGTLNSGSVPASIGNLLNLREIRIIGTELEGELLSNLGNLTNLTDLYIPGAVFSGSGNNFTGEIPESIGNLTNLIRFQINENSFEGQLPSSLSNLTELSIIGLSDNNLSGPIPDLTGFTNLESVGIALDNNYFNFSNLEPLVNNGVTYGFLSYSPQRTLDEEIQIESLPGVDITLDVNTTNLERNAEDTATGNAYQWYKDNVAISGGDSSAYIIISAQETDSGVYYCEITNTTLPDLVIVRANITVLIDENLNAEDFEINDIVVFPNPATNWISVKTKSGTNAFAQVFDINGKLILKKELTSEITAISIERLAAGVYIIKVSNNKMQATQRFIKQ